MAGRRARPARRQVVAEAEQVGADERRVDLDPLVQPDRLAGREPRRQRAGGAGIVRQRPPVERRPQVEPAGEEHPLQLDGAGQVGAPLPQRPPPGLRQPQQLLARHACQYRPPRRPGESRAGR